MRLVANINRREISSEEITKSIDEIAKSAGWKPKRIAEVIGRSERWVLKYISQEYKDVKVYLAKETVDKIFVYAHVSTPKEKKDFENKIETLKNQNGLQIDGVFCDVGDSVPSERYQQEIFRLLRKIRRYEGGKIIIFASTEMFRDRSYHF